VTDTGVVEGYVRDEFSEVGRVFRHQIERTGGGAALAVYHRGELVVDLWGGRRTEEGDPWTRDTLAMCFSTTKGVAATALHVLADRGLVDYDAPVAAYWPEFAQNGKEDITVRHVLSHSAGLHRFGTLIDRPSQALDWDYMVDALARAAPAYPPGTSAGYHGLTFGWLVGEIVRRVSGKPIDQFVHDQLAEPLGVEGLFIGCPPEARSRIAPLQPMALRLPGPVQQVIRLAGIPVAYVLSATGAPINLRRIATVFGGRSMEEVIYSPGILDSNLPAVNGFFDAVSLGAMYAMLAGGGALGDTRLLSPATVERMSEIQNDRRDRVVMLRMQWRLGYHRLVGTSAASRAFGHFGFGGSGGWADPDHDAALALVCNRGTGTPIGDLRIRNLTNAVADILVRTV
jgi:CubicO group peptidase (beta-lactamase class C family)